MTVAEDFVSSLSNLEVSSAYIYVADAVRWDHLPSDISAGGTTVKTIASSTTSAPSFSSLVTGLYPATHGVFEFGDRLDHGTFTVFDIDGIQTAFRNSIFEYAHRDHQGVDPIYTVLDVRNPDSFPCLGEIDRPFVHIERGPGGHIPYGDYRSTDEYFDRRLDAEHLRRDYERSIELDKELFSDRLATLRDRGIQEDTLVVYTSDHGELLGEDGLVGHNSPMRPELAHVPTVFYHTDLPDGCIDEHLLEHVDLLPTVLSILDIDYDPGDFDGSSMLHGFADDLGITQYRNRYWSAGALPGVSLSLSYDGIWGSGGGYVYPREHRVDRALVLTAKLLQSPKRSYLRRHLRSNLRAYLAGPRTFGSPLLSESQARTILEDFRDCAGRSPDAELNKEQREQLRNLGYL
jgi:hypothetical protein